MTIVLVDMENKLNNCGCENRANGRICYYCGNWKDLNRKRSLCTLIKRHPDLCHCNSKNLEKLMLNDLIEQKSVNNTNKVEKKLTIYEVDQILGMSGDSAIHQARKADMQEQRIRELNEMIRQLEYNISRLESISAKKDLIIENFDNDVKQLLVSNNQKDAIIRNLQNEIMVTNQAFQDFVNQH